ncbi:retrovirus-related pol polyprotein from transposon TNT 1-94, partial [Tanacetum coccineum]
ASLKEKLMRDFFVGYYVVSKAMRVFNKRTRIVEETLNIRFLENAPNVIGNGPDWLFDVDSLSKSINYVPVVAGNQTNGIAGTRDNIIVGPEAINENAGEKPTKVDEKPKKVIEALDDSSWIEEMQEKLLLFKLQKVWTLVDLPDGKRAIRTKWVFRNKRDERGIVVKNKARLVAQGYTQEEGINYDEVFAPVARIEAIRLFLAYASFMGFIMYQMDVNSAFLYGIIEEEVYVCQPPGFEDPQFPDKVYKVGKALYGLHQAPKAWYETLSTYFLENGFRRGTIDKILFIKKDKNDAQEIPYEFYVGAHLLPRIIASTPMEPNKALVKDEEAKNVDVHLYRLKIGSLMYLTASRPDITFAICACARDSPFDLEDFSDSDYAGASLDIKSTTGGEANYVNMVSRMDGRNWKDQPITVPST